MNDALSQLVQIAKTPVQTVALNHFEIARDALRQGLYRECLEELEKAINGDHTSSGYKLEWRFHLMMGTLRLGFAGGDLALVDSAQAEESFLTAARYAKTDYPQEAGRALLSAGWAAYCQGKLNDALAYTKQAIEIYPGVGEALFQAAKIQMALGEVEEALPLVGRAIDLDSHYALKAAADRDFQKYDDRLRAFLEALRQEKYRQYVFRMRAVLEKIMRRWEGQQSLFAGTDRKNPDVERIEDLLTDGAQLPLFDLLAMMKEVSAFVEAADMADGESLSRLIDAQMVFDKIERLREEDQSLFPEVAKDNADIVRVQALIAQGVQLSSQELHMLTSNVRASIEKIEREDEKRLMVVIDARNDSLRKTKDRRDMIKIGNTGGKIVGVSFLIACVVEVFALLIIFSAFDWGPKRLSPTRIVEFTHSGTVKFNYGSESEEYVRGQIIRVVSENNNSICVESRYGKNTCFDKGWFIKNAKLNNGYYLSYSNVLSWLSKFFWIFIFPIVVWIISAKCLKQIILATTENEIHRIESDITKLSAMKQRIRHNG